MKCQINLDIYSPKGLDFCPAALLRRTSVFAAGENLGAGRIHSARACKSKGWRPSPAAKTQKERHDVSRVFLFGTPEGTRTPNIQNRNLTLYPIELRALINRSVIIAGLP